MFYGQKDGGKGGLALTIEELYQANYRVVYGYLFSLCGERALAEDLAAETFLRAMEHPGSFDGSAKPSTWLCAIGKNLYLNECRRRKRKRRALEQLAEPPRAAQSLEETVALREDAWRVLQAADGLPELQRQVVCLRLQGMRFSEIAACLGKGESWARVTFFRAKNRILERWEEKT